MKKLSKLIMGIIAAVILLAAVILTIIIISVGGSANSYESHIELARQYLDELKYEQAIAEYEVAIAIDPKNTEAYIALAEVYIEMENYEAAVEILEQGVNGTESEILEYYLDKVQKKYEITQEQNEEFVEDSAQDNRNENSNTQMPEEIEEKNKITLGPGKYLIDVPTGYSVSLQAEMETIASIYTEEKSSGDTIHLNYKKVYNIGDSLFNSNGYITYLTIYSGSFQADVQKFYYDNETNTSGQWNDSDNSNNLIWYSETDIEGVFGVEISEGQTVTIDNQNYNGDILFCEIKYYVLGSDDLSGYCKETDYWWKTYMRYDETEDFFELTEGIQYYSFLESCNKLQYTVTSGSMVWFTEYPNKDLLIISFEDGSH